MEMVFSVLIWELSWEEASKKNSNEENCGGERLLPLLTAHQVKLEYPHMNNTLTGGFHRSMKRVALIKKKKKKYPFGFFFIAVCSKKLF